MFWDFLEKNVGHRERKLASVLLIGLGGLSIISFSSSWFPFLDASIENYSFLSIRNLLGILLILISIGLWKNRLG